MSDDTVVVEFEPPRAVSKVKRSIYLSAPDLPTIQLPVSQVIQMTSVESPEGELVNSVTIPRFIAEDRGLVPTPKEESEADEMTPTDWWYLGLTMAFVIRGDPPRDALWEASKMVATVMREEDQEE